MHHLKTHNISSIISTFQQTNGFLQQIRGREDDLSFFDYLSPFCFQLIEFHCSVFISCKIRPCYVYQYCILIGWWWAVGTFFFRARFTFFHTHASLLTFFVCLIVLFHSCCSHSRVFGKTLVHEFPISYSHTERYFLFSLFGARETKRAQRTIGFVPEIGVQTI